MYEHIRAHHSWYARERDYHAALARYWTQSAAVPGSTRTPEDEAVHHAGQAAHYARLAMVTDSSVAQATSLRLRGFPTIERSGMNLAIADLPRAGRPIYVEHWPTWSETVARSAELDRIGRTAIATIRGPGDYTVTWY